MSLPAINGFRSRDIPRKMTLSPGKRDNARAEELQHRLREYIRAFTITAATAVLDSPRKGTFRLTFNTRKRRIEYSSESKHLLYKCLDRHPAVDMWKIEDNTVGVTYFRYIDEEKRENFDQNTVLPIVSTEIRDGIFVLKELGARRTTYFEIQNDSSVSKLSKAEALETILRNIEGSSIGLKAMAGTTSLLLNLTTLCGYGALSGEVYSRAVAPAASTAMSTLSSWAPAVTYGGLTMVAGLSGASRIRGKSAAAPLSMGAVFLSIASMKFAEAIPLCPQYITTYNTPGAAYDVDFFTSDRNETFMVIADQINGAEIVNITDINQPTPTSNLPTPGTALRVKVVKNLVFLGDYDSGLQIGNLTEINSPIPINSFNTSGGALQVVPTTPDLDAVLIADQAGGVKLVNSTDFARLRLHSAYNTSDWAVGAAFVGNNSALFSIYSDGLQSFDLSNDTLTPLGTCAIPGQSYYFDVNPEGTLAAVPAWAEGLYIVDIRNLSNMTITGNCSIPGNAIAAKWFGQHVLVAHNSGWSIVDAENPFQPSLERTFSTPNAAQGISTFGEYAFICNYHSGVQIYKLTCPTTTTSSTTSSSRSSTTSSTSSFSSATSTTSSESSTSKTPTSTIEPPTSAPKTQTRSPTSVSRRVTSVQTTRTPNPSTTRALSDSFFETSPRSQNSGFSTAYIVGIALLGLTVVALPIALLLYFRKRREGEEAQNELSVVPSAFSEAQGSKEENYANFPRGKAQPNGEHANRPNGIAQPNGEYANVPKREDEESSEEEVVYADLSAMERNGYDQLSDVRNPQVGFQEV
ncbi:MAG: hypothetical protein K1000chlam4_00161 [Chlamydiae bacterium]|nr:hypothetical protein [Chlamydiota bacterium]